MQSKTSAVGSVIEAMALGLSELDESMIRTQRDHWVDFAKGETSNGEAVNALERLGTLLAIPRFENETVDAYRLRLPMTAKVLMRGLTTARSLLELAIITLGAEPCPHQKVIKDAVIALGFPLETLSNCPVCKSGNKSSCPNSGKELLKAVITDNPIQQNRFTPLKPLQPGDKFTLENYSLHDDIPEIRINALEQSINYPFLHNLATGEIVFYAGKINPGQVLSLWPHITPEEFARYESYDYEINHIWHKQYPLGSAVLINTDGSVQTVSEKIFFYFGAKFPSDEDIAANAPELPRYASQNATEGICFAETLIEGHCFGSALFAGTNDPEGARFGGRSQRVRSPRIRSGKDEWLYGVYTRKDVEAITGNSFGDLLDNAPDNAGMVAVTLTLSWWSRLPASFRLTIPQTDKLKEAQTLGATDLLMQWIQKYKAAGVLAIVDFPKLPLPDEHGLDVQLTMNIRQQWHESMDLEDTLPNIVLSSSLNEQHLVTDGVLAQNGIFGYTTFESSFLN
jgi:hypothetical protein